MKIVTPLVLLSLLLAKLNGAPAGDFGCPDEWTHVSNAVTYHGPYDTQAAAVGADGKKAIEDEETTVRALCPTACDVPPPEGCRGYADFSSGTFAHATLPFPNGWWNQITVNISAKAFCRCE